jgi:hypothetical protein
MSSLPVDFPAAWILTKQTGFDNHATALRQRKSLFPKSLGKRLLKSV